MTIARETGNRDYEAGILTYLGACFDTLGQTERALDHHQQALTIYRGTGNRDGEAAALNNLGLCYATLGETEQAIDHHQQALTIARETGNRDYEAAILTYLGACYATLGQTEQAIEHHQQSMTITMDTGNRYFAGSALIGLGESLWISEQLLQAEECFSQAAEFGEHSGDEEILTGAYLGLARVHLDEQEWAQARHDAETARVHGHGPSLPPVLIALGTAALRVGDNTAAMEAFAAVLSTTSADSANVLDAYSRALATAGQAVITGGDTAGTRHTFEYAVALSTAPGLVATVRRQFDLIAADQQTMPTVRQILLI